MIAYEGTEGVGAGFQVLGQVAGRELMSSPDVGASLAGFSKHMDMDRIQELVNKGLVAPTSTK